MEIESAATLAVVVGEKPFVLRLPEDLKAELEGWAKRERRSLNSLIIVLLEQDVRAERKRRAKD